MGTHFYHRFKLIPGFHLHMDKPGTSASSGAHPPGRRAAPHPRPNAAPKLMYVLVMVGAVAAFVAMAAMLQA
jgi:hypothetical protein